MQKPVALLAASVLALTTQLPVFSQSDTPAAAPVTTPVAVQGGVQNVDLPLSQADLIHLEIKQGFFDQYSVGQLDVDMHTINLREGNLQSLELGINSGEFNDVYIDQLHLKTAPFSFDTMSLLNHQRFVLDHPVSGEVSVIMTEDGLNRLVQEPKLREKIERRLQKTTGGIKLITLENPKVDLGRGNEVKLSMTLSFGGVEIPVEMQGHLALQNGNLAFTDMQMTSSSPDQGNVTLPPDLAQLVADQLNDVLQFNKLAKNDIQITGDTLKMSPKRLEIDGHATMSRLEFGKKTKAPVS